MNGRLRSLLLATTATTSALILIGIYTAAAGAGLTCEARWPLCDGAVFGLFPANWPSFIEWFHRLIAMVAGFLVIGAAYGAWRWESDRRVRLSVTLALVLFPVQALLGAGTVLQYTFVYLTAHLSTALVIFASLALATLWSYGDDAVSVARVRYALLAVVGAVPVMLALSPGLFFVHTPVVQVVYNAAGLLAFTGFVVVAAWSALLSAKGRLDALRVVSSVGAVVVGLQLLVGRFVYTELIQLLDAATLVATAVLAICALTLASRVEPRRPRLAERTS
ncbi:COX15/CtaA family protein [Natronorarus salvus]|uniref:COX15/CtaA family protein n=1 Tax=Natronorarus salvus TaxID=3117733 RepID=UPI002F264ED0